MKPATFLLAVNPNPSKGELTVLFAGESQTAPRHKVGPQVLDYHLVRVVLSGKGRFTCRGKTYELRAGECFFIFPGELIGYESDAEDPWRYRWVGFRGAACDEMLASIGVTAHRPVLDGCDRRTQSLFARIRRTLDRGGAGADWEAGGYFRAALGRLAESREAPEAKVSDAPAAHQQVERAIRWLTVQYSQPVSIEQMAQTLGYHRTHLSKLFKRHTGMSPMHFLTKLRLERAKALLTEELTIEQAASSVGFADPLYFSKQFKRWVGCSPSEYRQSVRPRDLYDCSRSPP